MVPSHRLFLCLPRANIPSHCTLCLVLTFLSMMSLVDLTSDQRIGSAVQIQLWSRWFIVWEWGQQDCSVGKARTAAKTDNLNSIPKTYMTGENGVPKVVL